MTTSRNLASGTTTSSLRLVRRRTNLASSVGPFNSAIMPSHRHAPAHRPLRCLDIQQAGMLEAFLDFLPSSEGEAQIKKLTSLAVQISTVFGLPTNIERLLVACSEHLQELKVNFHGQPFFQPTATATIATDINSEQTHSRI